MAVRSTTSQHQPSPPNYAQGVTGPWHNIGNYRRITSVPATQTPVGPNMCTPPIPANTQTQFQYIPGING